MTTNTLTQTQPYCRECGEDIDHEPSPLNDPELCTTCANETPTAPDFWDEVDRAYDRFKEEW